jgi:hypothetical protein
MKSYINIRKASTKDLVITMKTYTRIFIFVMYLLLELIEISVNIGYTKTFQ